MLTCLVLWCESEGKIPGVHYFCSPWSITTSSTDSPRSFKRSHEDTSTDSEGNKGQIKRARREIKIRHNYRIQLNIVSSVTKNLSISLNVSV
ncbi:hypothetical protein JTB14_023443 [Gonioctena quinquepunctata]|nr:hypothetical protein JTB14_023443 [Gonioctena quinquepunctata]